MSSLIEAAKVSGADFAVDVYPHYSSDADAALTAGYDVRHGLIGQVCTLLTDMKEAMWTA